MATETIKVLFADSGVVRDVPAVTPPADSYFATILLRQGKVPAPIEYYEFWLDGAGEWTARKVTT